MTTDRTARRRPRLALLVLLGAALTFIPSLFIYIVVGEAPVDEPYYGLDPVALVLAAANAILGTFIFAFGFAFAHVTYGFTFDFGRSGFEALARRVWVANLVLSLALVFALAPAAGLALTPLFGSTGYATNSLPILLFFLAYSLSQAFFNLWALTLARYLRRRLTALGVSQAALDRAELVGISDPKETGAGKIARLDDDVGGLWIAPDGIRYIGDSRRFEIPWSRLRAVERATDNQALSDYVATVPVLLRFEDAAGQEANVRLRAISSPRTDKNAKSLDRIAAQIIAHHASAPAA